ncbi:MAG: 50S ribosomal protein L22 [Nanoarchaeota archaeon]
MERENTAKIKGMDLPISTKHSIELCNLIRYKTLQQAKKQLNLIYEQKKALPLRRFHKDRGHRKGKIGPGAYPIKATKEIIKLLNGLEANAQNKGLNTNSLVLVLVKANMASRPMRYGRQRGIRAKRTHIEIIAEEKIQEKFKTQEKKEQTTKEKSKETKK